MKRIAFHRSDQGRTDGNVLTVDLTSNGARGSTYGYGGGWG